jgi:hypothetical protein
VDAGKAQWVRVADVMFVGPLMVVAARRVGGRLGDTLGLLGFLTVLYNASNYLRLRGIAP